MQSRKVGDYGGTVEASDTQYLSLGLTGVVEVERYKEGDDRRPKGIVNAFQPQVLRVVEVLDVETEGMIGTLDICVAN